MEPGSFEEKRMVRFQIPDSLALEYQNDIGINNMEIMNGTRVFRIPETGFVLFSNFL